MKARILPGWVLGMVLAGGVAVLGVAQDAAKSSPRTVPSNGSGVPTPPATATAVSDNTPDRPSSSNPQLPPSALEVQRLVQAQVADSVILAYITNSAGIFNLDADHIIHFKNLGASPQVINAMIRHDQELFSGARPLIVAAVPSTIAGDASQIAANDETWSGEFLVPDDAYYAPEQPASTGPVRAPYPVKLNDPIIILKLPSFTVPYW